MSLIKLAKSLTACFGFSKAEIKDFPRFDKISNKFPVIEPKTPINLLNLFCPSSLCVNAAPIEAIAKTNAPIPVAIIAIRIDLKPLITPPIAEVAPLNPLIMPPVALSATFSTPDKSACVSFKSVFKSSTFFCAPFVVTFNSNSFTIAIYSFLIGLNPLLLS